MFLVGYNIQQGGFLDNIKSTLLELVTQNFIEIKKNTKKPKNRNRVMQNSKFSISTILINSEIKKIKNEDKEKKSEEDLEETADEESGDKKRVIVNGGYGTINKHYGISPVVKYSDYNKIWGHLGTFRTYNMYGNDSESSNEIAMKNGESSREMVSTETIEKAAKHFKYFVVGEASGDIGFVPPFGSNIDSKEWEKYKLMFQMSIYQPLLKLKWSTA